MVLPAKIDSIRLSSEQSQLTLKFQLAHFVVSQGKAFKLYEHLAKFEIGAYLNDKDCTEMMRCHMVIIMSCG